MNALVGYTGFVGSNLYKKGQFDHIYNSKNITDSYGSKPDLLIYAGMRAEKYLANHAPDKDMLLVEQATENIVKIAPKKLILISTIDVFKSPLDVDEETPIDCTELQPYGYNRYQLECRIREYFPDALIIRLPGLFGINIKKNFIYDFINIIPFMLNHEKFEELSKKEPDLHSFYVLQDNGFFKCRDLFGDEKRILQKKFQSLGFTALNFTDSRSIYQFYPLARLWDDIQIALDNSILLWHPATEPVSASEIYQYLTGNPFINELHGIPANYDYKTKYAKLLGGRDKYICQKDEIMQIMAKFINEQKKLL